MILDATTKSIRAYLSGAAATTNPVFVSDWGDHDSGLAPGNLLGSLNGATPVTVVAAPAGTAKRQVRRINIFNVDTAPVTVTVEVYDSANQWTVGKFVLAVGEQAEWHDGGWQIRTVTGDPRPVDFALPAAGASGAVQYNNSGALGGAANVTVPASGNLRLAASTLPATPGAGLVEVFGRNRGGRLFPAWVGPSGVDTAVQPAFFGNTILMWIPNISTTAAINFGTSWTTVATLAHPTVTAGSILNNLRRATFTTTAVAGNASSTRSLAVTVMEAGFYFAARFGFVTVNASQRFGIGLTAQTTANAGNWSAVNNTAVIGKDDTDTNMQLIFRDGTTTTKVDLGVAPAAGDVYDFAMFCAPGGSTIYCRVVRLNDGTVYADNTAHSTNIPLSTTAFAIHAMVGTQSANAQSLALNKMYLETDI